MVHHLEAKRLDRIFHALSDATRRDMLRVLEAGPSGLTAFSSAYSLSLPAIAKHVRVLENAGLARTTKAGRVRRVTARPEGLSEAAQWIEHYRQFWSDALDRLAAHFEKEGSDASN